MKSKRGLKGSLGQNIITIAALAALVIVFAVLNPNFLSKYNIVSMAQSLAPYAIMALGVTFVIATGGIDLSIGTVCIASAVVAGKLYMVGMPLWATIPVMIAIGTLFGLINGLLVAKLKIPGVKLINTLIMLSLMFVPAVTDVANYLTNSWLGWLDDYRACIIPLLGASLGLFIMRNYMTTIPDSLLEAAKIDGCSDF